MEINKTIKIAKHAGTCFGVDKAIQLAFEAVKKAKGKNIFILGDLVHNPSIVNKLGKEGVKIINSIYELKGGDTLIIRSHGELKSVFDYCNINNINIIDCTCSFVKQAQTLASKLEKDHQIIILGEADHPEVKGIASQTKNAKIIASPKEINYEDFKNYPKLAVLSQTTQNEDRFNELVSKIKEINNAVNINNTICSATKKRQSAALELCDEVEIMIVIGGKKSSNTKQLYELCNKKVKTYLIVDKEELEKEWFSNVNNIGITAGASTPKESINEVIQKIEQFY